MNKRPLISVYGSSQPHEDQELYQEALELGRRLAQAGFDVMTGGYDGTMAAVSRGANEAGGHVVGVTMELFNPSTPNRWVHEERRRPGFPERLRDLTELADAFVVLRGGIGTLTEFAYTWGLLQTGAIQNKPLVTLGNPWKKLVALLDEEEFWIADRHYSLLEMANTSAEVISLLQEHFSQQPAVS